MNLLRLFVLSAFCLLPITAAEPSQLVRELSAGRSQHLVVYGTSLSKSGAWVAQTHAALDARFPGLLKLTNSARGGQHSGWGLANVDSAVIAEKPDTVLIEFAMNDSVTRFELSLATIRHNVDSMLDRIAPQCEIILQVMNPAVGHPEGDPSHRRDQNAYQQIYRDAAKARGLRLVDHSIAWNALLAREGDAGFKRFVPDGVHPNAAGYAQFVTPTLLRALGVRTARRHSCFQVKSRLRRWRNGAKEFPSDFSPLG